MTAYRPASPPDVIAALDQIKSELEVVWCALTNPHHESDVSVAISEHVNSLRQRLAGVVLDLEGGAV